MSLAELIEWIIYDEMTGIMAETKRLDPKGMPDHIAIEMTIKHQEKHGWIGRVDPKKRRPPKLR